MNKEPSTSNSTENINSSDSCTEQPKKLVIVGLPSVAATKTGFGSGENRPGYKAKSSKKTGAKYRVRQ